MAGGLSPRFSRILPGIFIKHSPANRASRCVLNREDAREPGNRPTMSTKESSAMATATARGKRTVMNAKAAGYSEASIKVLKGLEPVKQRPGMYTRTENPLHIIQEVIDNASDEALGGYGKQIVVTLHNDNSVSVDDDGRGIPFGLHPEEGVPVVEIVFTRLHAGGKFDKAAGGAYTFSGGLHGVGVSVTNALATRLEVTVWRDNKVAQLAFSNGNVVEALTTRAAERGEKKTGTRVRAWPNAKYFDSAHLPLGELQRLLRSKAVLLPGVEVVLVNEKTGERQSWKYEDGLRGYLLEGVGGSDLLIPLFEGERYAESSKNTEETFAEGEGASWVVAWSEEGPLLRESYVNLIPTPAGGTHESGLRDGLFQAVKNFVEIHNLQPKGVKLLAEDVFARVSFVLSAKVLDPQFQGQIKERLNSRDAVKLVSSFSRPALELWLNQHVEYGKKLAELVIRQAQARTRAGQKVEKKKSSGVAVLPGKLTDCESTDIARNELFLVEGDSAGGSAKMGRDKEFQAILPLRGKVLNTWETQRDRLFANNEVHDIAVAIGVDPHGPDEQIDLSNLRYGKICILSDADVDGAHIQVLLLTLFFKHFPQLIERGHVCVARPPLFRVDAPARGKKPAQKLYALDEGELEAILDKLRKDGVRETAWTISRFKGLGEMSAEQLWDTTMNPDTRRLLPVGLGDLGFDLTVSRMTMLMGKGEAASRRSWLEEKGNEVEADI
ncbi:Topoisomerase IV subunit B [Candidatus Paraburkholderia kirkii UZHbot1]|uniref:DNA topoisomerase 4 subunit B n=1 Tax=Candidatus Paraburkholderia kirkii UZHbot1 TaxID=1055526 RepID=G4MG00_9BURK|nr:Topoisomerase IV subunit B [Candidatus Paraburkholderia kirkii UZHbot1]